MIVYPNFNQSKAERCFENLGKELNELFDLLDYSKPAYLKLKCEDIDFDNYTEETINDIKKTYEIISSAEAVAVYEETVDMITEELDAIGEEMGKSSDDTLLSIDVNTREFSMLVRAVILAIKEGKSKQYIFRKIKSIYKNMNEECMYLDELNQIYEADVKFLKELKDITDALNNKK